MKCPDCGNRLAEVRLDPNSVSHRCMRCGGFWIDSWSVNRLNAEALKSWRRISINPAWVSGGKGVCPQDGTKLSRYTGENIPPNVTVSRCVRCGKWWFGGENLFVFKPALEAKVNYFKQWGKAADLAALALPIAAVVLLLVGTVAGIGLMRRGTQLPITATAGVAAFSTIQTGDGQILLTFSLQGIQEREAVQYRKQGETGWKITSAARIGASSGNFGIFQAQILDLSPGKYEVMIEGKGFGFEAR